MSIEAMKLALEALKNANSLLPCPLYSESIAALRTAIQQPAQAVNEKHFGDFELLVVTTAYEQGFGHAFRTELSNPYAPATNAYKAWDMGRSAGKRNGQPQQPATGEPVGQVSDLFPSVRNKLHAKGFDSDAPSTPAQHRVCPKTIRSPPWSTKYATSPACLMTTEACASALQSSWYRPSRSLRRSRAMRSVGGSLSNG